MQSKSTIPQRNSLFEKSNILCPFILRRGRRAKGDNCDFSRSRVDNTSKKYQSVNLPKHMVFCLFLRKRGYCKKGSRCDFRHNSTYQSSLNHQPPNTSPRRPVQLYQQHKVPPVSQIQLPPFFGNRQQNNITASLNRLEMRLQNIEYAQTSYPSYSRRLPPQPMYQPLRSAHPSPLMEISVYPPQYPRYS